MGFFHRDEPQTSNEAQDADTQAQLSADSTIREWLDHPVGGQIFRDMLTEAGQNEKVLTPVKGWSLKRVAGMSGGKMTDEMISDMVSKANSGGPTSPDNVSVNLEAPNVQDGEPLDEVNANEVKQPTPEAAEWVEKITEARFSG